MSSFIPVEGKKRLIVLVPDGMAGNLDLAHRIYWMAVRDRSEVYYLALFDNNENVLSVMRNMATMKAVTGGNSLVVQSVLAESSRWLTTLQKIYRPGDCIVCHEEQSVKNGFLKTLRMSGFLQERFNASVVIISGFYHPGLIQVGHWVHTAATWLGFLLILAVFTWLEIQLDPIFKGLPGKLLLGILFTMEIGSIWAWDSIIGQSR